MFQNNTIAAGLPAAAAASAALLIGLLAVPAALLSPLVPEAAPLVPKLVRTISYRIEALKEGQAFAALQERPTEGWPRVLPRPNIEPSPTEAWASATPEERYLCEVYWRVPVKRDRSGDFSWKDPLAAGRREMGVCEYAIGGMAPAFKKALASLGERLDEKGLRWSMLSAFRDDYRQGIASGFKASGGNSLHGGSRATKGYGDGRAVDVTVEPVSALGEVFKIIDTFGRSLGITRPMPRYDAAHIQFTGSDGNKKLIAKVIRKRQPVRVKKNVEAQQSASFGFSELR